MISVVMRRAKCPDTAGVRCSWLLSKSTSSSKYCFSTASGNNPNANNDNIMANVVQGPSLVLTSLHRPEPTLMIVPGLRSLPFWTNHNGQIAYQDPQISEIVEHLQQNVAAIREEYQRVSPTLPSDYDATTKSASSSAGTEHNDDVDGSLHTGSWDWHSYLLHGQVQPTFCEQFPVTTKIIQSIGTHLFTHNPFGFCFFSKLSANSSIRAHASPINFRLRIHLPLIVPQSSTSSSKTSTAFSNTDDHNDHPIGIHVGPTIQSWIQDQAMVLDDSYNHQVWNNTNDERVVLLIDIWHPDVRPREREEIVRMFQHAKLQGWLTNK